MHNKSLDNTTKIAVQAETTSDSDTDACWDCFVIAGACTQKQYGGRVRSTYSQIQKYRPESVISYRETM